MAENENRLIAQLTGASSVERSERIQSVWSGYGQLVRYELAGSALASVVVKHVKPGKGSGRSHQRKLRSYEVEQTWYQDWAGRCGEACRVARCLHAERRAGEWIFVFEDLDGAGFGGRHEFPSGRPLQSCLCWLAEFHAQFMGQRPRGLWKTGTYWHLKTRPDEHRSMARGPLRDAAAAIDARLGGARFLTLVHGDAKPANFCFSKDGASVAAVDFQYVGGGCGVKDVAYLLAGEQQGTVRQGLDVYFRALRRALGGGEGAALEAEWRALYPLGLGRPAALFDGLGAPLAFPASRAGHDAAGARRALWGPKHFRTVTGCGFERPALGNHLTAECVILFSSRSCQADLVEEDTVMLRLACWMVVCVTAVAGCNDGVKDGPRDAGLDRPGAGNDVGTSRVVGASGGVYSFQGGRVKLEVPPGALNKNTSISVVPAKSYPLDPGLVQATVYELLPDGLVFARPVKLIIAYKGSNVPKGTPETGLGIHKVVSNSWQKLAGGVDTYHWTAWAAINGFSKYGIKGPAPLSVDGKQPPKDAAVDSSKDLTAPDLSVPDLSVPDLPVPDLLAPDTLSPDTLFVPLKPWVQQLGSSYDERARALAVDGAGNVFIAGFFRRDTSIGGYSLASKSGICVSTPYDPKIEPTDIFAAKLSKSGLVLWATAAVGADCYEANQANGVAVDSTGNNVVITGSFELNATFGTTKLTSMVSGSSTGSKAFVARLDNKGKFLWAVAAGGDKYDTGAGSNAVALDGAGNSHITGHFKGTVKFGSITLSSYNKTQDIFVAKLDSNGKFLWATVASSTGAGTGSGIAVDSAGNSVVTGHLTGSAAFGSTALSAKGAKDVFVARLDKSGTFLWASGAGGISEDAGSGVALDGAGNSTITGHFGGKASFGSTSLTSKGGDDLFVARLDKGGKFLWAVSAGGVSSSYSDRGHGVATDSKGNSTVTGQFNGTASFGSTTLTGGTSKADIFVTRLDKGGKFLWTASAGGTDDDVGSSVATDSAGDSVITGYFESNASFGSTKLNATGGEDIFVARVDNTWSLSGPSPACVACCNKCTATNTSCIKVCYDLYDKEKKKCNDDYSTCFAAKCKTDAGYTACNNCDIDHDACMAVAQNGIKYCPGYCTAAYSKCIPLCSCTCP